MGQSGLLRWEDNEIVIEPELLGVKVFRNLWNRDRTVNKEKAKSQLTTLYFMYNPKTPYRKYTDLVERKAAIMEETDVPDWERDKIFMAVVPLYSSWCITTSSKLLDNNRKSAEDIGELVSCGIPEDMTNADRLDYGIKLAKLTSESNKLAEEIVNTEEAVFADIDEQVNKAKGSVVLNVGDDMSFMDNYKGDGK